MDLLRELGSRVLELRHRKGFSRQELAQRAGLSARFLADVESGRGNISLARLLDLCKALGISLSVLMESLGSAKGDGQNSSDAYSAVLAMLSECSPQQLAETRLWLQQRLRNERRSIALIGLRGAGKTTIGKKLAAKLRCKFVELDDLVEKAAGLALQNIFEVHGEEYYRRLESEALRNFLQEAEPAILATGGGIVTREETYELLRRHCVTVWLRATPEDHWNRVLKQDPRPITNYPNAMDQLQTLLRRREPLYALADHTIDTSALGIRRSVQQVVKLFQS